MRTDEPHRPLQILVVDDHVDSACMVEALLGRVGHRVTVAHSFADAVAAAASLTAIDVLVADIGLPDGNGCDLLPRLRGRAGGGPCHAIALTGHGDERWEAACREAGYSTFLLKPVKFEDVLAAVQASAPREPLPSLGGVPSPLALR